MNEGSGDYALQVASNSDETGIRVAGTREDNVETGDILSGRSCLGGCRWHCPGWLPETGKRVWFQTQTWGNRQSAEQGATFRCRKLFIRKLSHPPS